MIKYRVVILEGKTKRFFLGVESLGGQSVRTIMEGHSEHHVSVMATKLNKLEGKDAEELLQAAE